MRSEYFLVPRFLLKNMHHHNYVSNILLFEKLEFWIFK